MVNKQNVRLTACIHNVTEVSSLRNVWGRLLDFVFLAKDRSSLGVNEIVAFIRDELRLPFEIHRHEIIDCALARRKKYAVRMHEGHVSDIMLEKHYRETLMHTWDVHALDDAIRVFYQHGLSHVMKQRFDAKTVADAIYAWLKIVALRSHRDVERMLCGTMPVQEMTDDGGTLPRSILSLFITWDNKTKDDVLMSVFNAGLAFATMNQKADLIRVFRPEDHVVYLDVDILSAISGLKGFMQQGVMETFLGKCRDMGISIRVSIFTHDAFKQHMKSTVHDIRHDNQNGMEMFDDVIRHTKSKRALKACFEQRFKRALNRFAITLEEDVRHRRRIKKQAKALKKSFFECHDAESFKKHHLWTGMMNLSRLNHRCRKKKYGDKNAVYLSDERLIHDIDINRGNDRSLIWHPSRLFAVLLKQLGRMTDNDHVAMMAMMKQDALKSHGNDDVPPDADSIGQTVALNDDIDESCSRVGIDFAKK